MSPRPLPRAIVFDFDLTLADSTPGFVECHEFAAARMGLVTPDSDAVGRTIGTPLPLAFRELYAVDDEDVAREYVRLYQARADEVMTGLTVMLDGAADALRTIAAAGIPLAIVSQKLRYRVEAVLQREGLLDVFAAILGGEEVPELKPDPRGLLLAVERLGSQPGQAIYVGDTSIDAEAARRAHVPFIAVLTGFQSAGDFGPYSPVAVLDSVRELSSYLSISSPSRPPRA